MTYPIATIESDLGTFALTASGCSIQGGGVSLPPASRTSASAAARRNGSRDFGEFEPTERILPLLFSGLADRAAVRAKLALLRRTASHASAVLTWQSDAAAPVLRAAVRDATIAERTEQNALMATDALIDMVLLTDAFWSSPEETALSATAIAVPAMSAQITGTSGDIPALAGYSFTADATSDLHIVGFGPEFPTAGDWVANLAGTADTAAIGGSCTYVSSVHSAFSDPEWSSAYGSMSAAQPARGRTYVPFARIKTTGTQTLRMSIAHQVASATQTYIVCPLRTMAATSGYVWVVWPPVTLDALSTYVHAMLDSKASAAATLSIDVIGLMPCADGLVATSAGASSGTALAMGAATGTPTCGGAPIKTVTAFKRPTLAAGETRRVYVIADTAAGSAALPPTVTLTVKRIERHGLAGGE